MPEQTSSKGKGRKVGRNKNKCSRYAAMHIREKNKLRRIRQSNGIKAAETYAKANNLSGYLAELNKKK